MSFTVVTYNVLADAYIRPRYYPATPPHLLQPGARRGALLERIAGLGADVVCLQEVERATYEAAASRLAGYAAAYARKSGGRPDGCATFSRGQARASRRLEYSDGTGHVALLVSLDLEGRLLGVANSHLKWDPPETPPGDQKGLAQIREVLDAIERFEPRCAGWVLCGDFNAEPESVALAEAAGRGWRDAYSGSRAPTCNPNRHAKRIDYLLHTPELQARPAALPALSDDTPMPSDVEPSDHLALMADFDWS